MSVFLGRSALGFGKLSGLAETTLLAFKINKFFCQEKKKLHLAVLQCVPDWSSHFRESSQKNGEVL